MSTNVKKTNIGTSIGTTLPNKINKINVKPPTTKLNKQSYTKIKRKTLQNVKKIYKIDNPQFTYEETITNIEKEKYQNTDILYTHILYNTDSSFENIEKDINYLLSVNTTTTNLTNININKTINSIKTQYENFNQNQSKFTKFINDSNLLKKTLENYYEMSTSYKTKIQDVINNITKEYPQQNTSVRNLIALYSNLIDILDTNIQLYQSDIESINTNINDVQLQWNNIKKQFKEQLYSSLMNKYSTQFTLNSNTISKKFLNLNLPNKPISEKILNLKNISNINDKIKIYINNLKKYVNTNQNINKSILEGLQVKLTDLNTQINNRENKLKDEVSSKIDDLLKKQSSIYQEIDECLNKLQIADNTIIQNIRKIISVNSSAINIQKIKSTDNELQQQLKIKINTILENLSKSMSLNVELKSTQQHQNIINNPKNIITSPSLITQPSLLQKPKIKDQIIKKPINSKTSTNEQHQINNNKNITPISSIKIENTKKEQVNKAIIVFNNKIQNLIAEYNKSTLKNNKIKILTNLNNIKSTLEKLSQNLKFKNYSTQYNSLIKNIQNFIKKSKKTNNISKNQIKPKI